MAANNQKDSSQFYELITEGGKSIFVIKKSLTDTNWSDIDQVGQDILKSIEEIARPQMMMDLSELDYMGSSMVALMLRIWKQVNSQQGKMVFVNQEEGIYEILKLAGLTNIWTICESREEAAQHLSSTLQQTGKKLSILLVLAAIITTGIGIGSYLILHVDTPLVDPVIFGKLQIAGSIVGMILTLWLIRSTSGKPRAASLLLFLLASAVLSLGFLDYRIPGLGDWDAGDQNQQSSAPPVELGESESSEQPPFDLFGESHEQNETNVDSGNSDPLRAPKPQQGTP